MTYQPIPLPHRMDYTDAEMEVRAEGFHAEIQRRHTVRQFSPKPVPREIIEACLRAAGTAPSGANHQPWHFAVVGDPNRALYRRFGVEASPWAVLQPRPITTTRSPPRKNSESRST